MESYEHALQAWLDMVNAMLVEHRKTFCQNLPPEQVKCDHDSSPKYQRIVRRDGSTFCFIRKDNGDVLKATSWRAPAPHARGNIFTRRESLGVNAFGANYIQRGKAK